MKIINECRIDYKYRFSPQSPEIRKTIFSNIVSTQVIKDTLEIIKSVNKQLTFPFDVLTYTIFIYNITNLDIENIFFKDNIPQNTRFIENSITINNRKLECENPQRGFFIGDLEGGGIIKVAFKVLVLPTCFCHLIENYSTIEYDYIYNVEKPPYRANKMSNKVISRCEKRVFKQILVEENIETCDDICFIENYRYNLQIIETKLINQINSNLGTLLVIGKLSYEINYISDECTSYIDDIFGFSTCMIVPIGISLESKEYIKYDIEELSINLINSNNIFLSMSLLLYY